MQQKRVVLLCAIIMKQDMDWNGLVLCCTYSSTVLVRSCWKYTAQSVQKPSPELCPASTYSIGARQCAMSYVESLLL